jgi:S-DNA-T family DNA segregation ATPase FtsK/SpoIIIE
MKRRKKLLIFAIMCVNTVVALRFRDELLQIEVVPRLAILVYYWFSLALPLLYTLISRLVRRATVNRYFKLFEEVNFKARNGKYPLYIRKKRDGAKELLHFKSTIPAQEWKKAHDRLESALNLSIRRIEQSQNSKKIVILTTLSTDYQIPEMLRYNAELIAKHAPNDGDLVVGESDLGAVIFNLNATPHVLCAGETGSGKSVILRLILWQMILKGCRVFMIDFKGGVEFGKQYEQYGEVILERERALIILEMLVAENEARMALFRDLEVKNLPAYNKMTGANLCRIGVFCDEIAEMLDTKGVAKSEKPLYDRLTAALSTLARLGRAQGINLFLGVQRPDANVLTGQIKNNVPVRISGRFAHRRGC